MKYLINKNIVTEIDKINDDIEKNSIKYTGYNNQGETIEVYDLENGKLAPIVRYLIEGETGNKSKMLMYFIIIGIVGFLIAMIFIFGGGKEEVKTPVETKNIIQQKEPEKQENIIKQKEPEKQENIFETKINDQENKILELSALKEEAEKETINKINELNKKDLQIEKINIINKDLEDKIAKLENQLKEELENSNKRIINNPKDDFIYYLGDTLYNKCENSLNEQILDNCKEIYFNFTKYGNSK